MDNRYQAVCNEQMAFCRYYLRKLAEPEQARLAYRAHLQGLILALQQSVLAYSSELASTFLRKADTVTTLPELLDLAAKRSVVSPELSELNTLSQQSGGWLHMILLFGAQSGALELFQQKEEVAVDASVIASTRVASPELTLELVEDIYQALEELVQRQRSHNIEC